MNKNLFYLLLCCFVCLILPRAGLAQEDGLPSSAFVSNVYGRPQTYNLSCESRSAADWAAFFGVTIDETEFLYQLPRSDNPDIGFVGYAQDPWGNTPPASYGVHADPVAQVLRSYGLNAMARRGLSWDDLRQELANGRPVIVWLVGNVWSGTPKPYVAANGQTSIVVAYEHTMILVGYDTGSVTLINAANGQREGYDLNSFLASWAVLGQMALVMAAPTAVSPSSDTTYTVQPGDSLLTVAARFGLSWYDLALYNNLGNPDVIFVGQVLHLPSKSGSTVVADTAVSTPPPPLPTANSSYVVQPGEYLIQIARTLGLEWQPIAQLNGLIPPQYLVYPGQILQLPGSGTTAAPPSPPVTTETYTVQPGDTLFKIALRYNLYWPTLADLNGIAYPYQIYAGQLLRLR